MMILIQCFLYYFAELLYDSFFYSLVNEARNVTSKLRLGDFFQRTDIVQKKDNYDSFIRGLLSQIAQEQDQYYTSEV